MQAPTKVSNPSVSSPNSGERFDYIIAGAGCAGLSLAMHLIASGTLARKKVLLIDKDPKQSNDRTWCFWEKENGLFDTITYRRWDELMFYGTDFFSRLNITPYQYKMIRGIDFYRHCLEQISDHSNFTILHQQVNSVFNTTEGAAVKVGDNTYHADYVFNSILFQKPELNSKQYWLLQHFKGWTIETETEAFDPGVATLMDFRIDQQWGTAFCYVLPLEKNKALVEYTLFSPQLLTEDQYKSGLQHYIGEVLKIKQYKVTEEEFGIIPMTNFNFPAGENKIVNIGTAGGQTKGSSGYTFSFIQKHSAAIVRQLEKEKAPLLDTAKKRFHFYDSVLLNILYKNTLRGKDIFTDLFKKNKPVQVLKFLDNETSLTDEIGIISTLPTLPFMKAAMQQMF